MSESVFIKSLTTFLGTCIIYATGGVDLIFTVLLFFMVIDYVTGVMKGIHLKELSSAIGWAGLMKKVGILIAVIVAHQMDKIDPTQAQIFRDVVITFFIANEGISIVENLAVLGVPIPNTIKTALKVWKNQSEGVDE